MPTAVVGFSWIMISQQKEKFINSAEGKRFQYDVKHVRHINGNR